MVNTRALLVLAVGLLTIVGLFVVYLGVGAVALAPGDVLLALLNRATDPVHRQIVWELRVPRALVGTVSGALLGLAGALLQAITRNPLAEPGLTGVSAGGVLAAVSWLTYGTGGTATLPFIAVLGGAAAGACVYLLARNRSGSTNPMHIALVGVLVSAVLSAATSLLLIRNTEALGSILLWLIGSLNGRVWTHWALLWPWALVALPLGLLSAGLANALQLGDEIAGGLGLAIERARAVLLAIAVLLTAGAIAVVGAIGFVGLIGPHLARRLVGEDARRVFPVSVVLSAGLLLGADTLAQLLTLNPPFATTPYRAGLPVGAVTALLGAPFFLYLLRQKQL
jgi:iron complex transport system permease protein